MMDTDCLDIPIEIAEAARKVEYWFAEQGINSWEFMGLCSRNHAAYKPLSTNCAGEPKHRDKPVISIAKGCLEIEDCSCSSITLEVRDVKELLALLPGLISIMEPMRSGNGAFKFGKIP